MNNQQQVYLIHPLIDCFFIGAFSLVVFVIMFFFNVEKMFRVDSGFFVLINSLVNSPHFAATLYQFYQNEESRKNHPWASYFSPVIILVGALYILLQPLDLTKSLQSFYFLWSSFHYGTQSLGISFLYCRRANIKLYSWERNVLFTFMILTSASCTARDEISKALFNGGVVNSWVVMFPKVIHGISLFCALSFLGSVLFNRLKQKRVVPWIAFIPLISHAIWFYPASETVFRIYLTPIFHGLQYLFITWFFRIGTEKIRNQKTSIRDLIRISLPWCSINIFVGHILMVMLPVTVHHLWSSLFMVATSPYLVIVIAVQIHHFYIDGIMWKLRSLKVRTPLVQNVSWKHSYS